MINPQVLRHLGLGATARDDDSRGKSHGHSDLLGL